MYKRQKLYWKTIENPDGTIERIKTTENTGEPIIDWQGKIDFKVDKSGIVHTSIGKVSFSADQIRDNAKEFISTLNN